ncbi:hypothetical protein EXW31_28030 (plasmid) [Bacillus mycoides]|nr:hypothetical protein EXW31_28030 [Bacillus mycoides]
MQIFKVSTYRLSKKKQSCLSLTLHELSLIAMGYHHTSINLRIQTILEVKSTLLFSYVNEKG